jgi:hypothetical protein
MVIRVLEYLKKSHFIVRGNLSRVIQIESSKPWLPEKAWLSSKKGKKAVPNKENIVNVRIGTLIEHIPMTYYRDIPLDARGRVCANAENAARIAKVSIGGARVRIARKSARSKLAAFEEKPVWINIVVARELNPPSNIKSPIFWNLLTDLPIETFDNCVRVAELYVCRWRTEEFFRTTKHAMSLEDSELDDPTSTARLLFFVTVRAMFLDELRADACLPAGIVPSTEQRKELEQGAKKAHDIEKARQNGKPVPAIPKKQRAIMTLGLIARRGGWASTNKSHLGNYVLLRGLPTFLHDVSEGRYSWLLE